MAVNDYERNFVDHNALFNLLIYDGTWGNPPVTGGFPPQRASKNAASVSMPWRHNDNILLTEALGSIMAPFAGSEAASRRFPHKVMSWRTGILGSASWGVAIDSYQAIDSGIYLGTHWFCNTFAVRHHVTETITSCDLIQSHHMTSLGAGNYQQPQLPSANMANADLDTKLYSPSMQWSSTNSWC